MVDNFMFRSAVKDAALWEMYMKMKGKPVEKKVILVTIYDKRIQFKTVIK